MTHPPRLPSQRSLTIQQLQRALETMLIKRGETYPQLAAKTNHELYVLIHALDPHTLLTEATPHQVLADTLLDLRYPIRLLEDRIREESEPLRFARPRHPDGS